MSPLRRRRASKEIARRTDLVVGGSTPTVPDAAPLAEPGPSPTPGAGPSPSDPPPHTPDPVIGIGIIDAALDKAVAIPSAVIHKHVDNVRRKNPHATPTQVVRILEKEYLLAISASGGAVGAAAAAPAVGTGLSLTLTSAEVATFFAASSAFALAVADVHGIGIEETYRRRTLLLATVLGEQGAVTVAAETGLGAVAWGRAVLLRMPTATIKRVNNALTRRFVTTQLTRQGALAIGRLAPFGIGAAVGIAGARALGTAVITGAERAFGPPPAVFPRLVDEPAPLVVDVPLVAGGAVFELPDAAASSPDGTSPQPGTPWALPQ